MKIYKILFTIFTLLLIPIVAKTVHAEEFIITGNGTGSENDLSVTSTNSTTVEQNNTANVENNVDLNANTGSNTANDNTGDAAIQTGDINASSSVENNLNSSQATVEDCNCDTSGNAQISNNGSFSDNSLHYATSTTNNATVNQYANVTNSLTGSANTGSNTANYNNGNTFIQTGNIQANEVIRNNANLADVSLSGSNNKGFDISIKGNGAHSNNNLTLSENSNNILRINNVADIMNDSFWDLITGRNTAEGNNGDVAIKTGDIDLDILIENNVNSSKVDVTCGCNKEEEKPPTPENPEKHEQPSNPPVIASNNPEQGKGGGEEEKAGEVLAAAVSAILPVTGTPWFILAILGNLLMLLFGTVLRLRSGRSPGLAYAV